MANFKEIGKGGIVKEGIFVRFPEIVPFVGEKYESTEHKKMLVICESNYLKDDFSSQCDFQDAEKWYTSPNAKLIPNDENIKKSFSNEVGDYKPFENLFASVKKVLQEAGKSCADYVLKEFAFYNYFLRPASVKNGDYSFEKDCEKIDEKVAGEALCGIIEEIKPDLVVFASTLAYEKFSKYAKSIDFQFNPIIRVNHPSDNFGCWTKNENNGVQKFENALKDYWI